MTLYFEIVNWACDMQESCDWDFPDETIVIFRNWWYLHSYSEIRYITPCCVLYAYVVYLQLPTLVLGFLFNQVVGWHRFECVTTNSWPNPFGNGLSNLKRGHLVLYVTDLLCNQKSMLAWTCLLSKLFQKEHSGGGKGESERGIQFTTCWPVS